MEKQWRMCKCDGACQNLDNALTRCKLRGIPGKKIEIQSRGYGKSNAMANALYNWMQLTIDGMDQTLESFNETSRENMELLKVRADFKKLSTNDINSERGKSLIFKIRELNQKIKAIKNSNQIKYKIVQSQYTNKVTLMPVSDYYKPIFLTNEEIVNFTAKTTGLENYATDRFGIATAINGTSCAIYLFRTLMEDAFSWHYLFRESVEQSVERYLKENNLEFEPIEI